jgi:hypothetical protein
MTSTSWTLPARLAEGPYARSRAATVGALLALAVAAWANRVKRRIRSLGRTSEDGGEVAAAFP